jgi:hypothetical protein
VNEKDNGSSTRIIVDMVKEIVEKQGDEIQELREKIIVLEQNSLDEDLKFNVKRVTEAFERDDLYNVIYGARDLHKKIKDDRWTETLNASKRMQKYISIIGTTVAASIGTAAWSYFQSLP